jgi:alpha-mannosidase
MNTPSTPARDPVHPNPFVLPRLERVRRQRLRPELHRLRHPVAVTSWNVPGEPVSFADALGAKYAPLAEGAAWGRPWGTTWIRVATRIPDDWRLADGEKVELVVDLGFHPTAPGFQAEGLVYTAQGRILEAIEPRNTSVVLDARPGESIELYIEAASNPDIAGGYTFAPSTLGHLDTAGSEPLYVFRGVELVVTDSDVWELERDLDVVTGLLEHLPTDRPRSAQLVGALTDMLGVLDPHDTRATAAAAREVLAPFLARPAHASAHDIVATGHAHIDSAWLWPVRETIRKCARTFANVLALMDEDDDFVFACSSAQQFEWMRAHYPELFARILDRVREGRFIPVGGMWVESDTNMPGSEAMVRQFVQGGAFFREELGVEAPEVWLPDSFGYSAGMPQIAVAAGARWFLTQKMSWNDTNRLPHHTFWWEGIDGTRVFTHFPPADTYNSDLSIADLDRAERHFADDAYATTSLLPFGFGNGGGGPTREMLAAAARTRDLEGAPRVRIASPADFFARAEAEYARRAPVWSGELYLEFHRGVFSSQARTKHGNRRAEKQLHDAELWATTAMVRTGAPYPADQLRELWRQTLLQQFHDILPGSSIAWVHREAEREYDRIDAEAEGIVRRSVEALTGEGDTELWVASAPVHRGTSEAMSVSTSPVDDDHVAPRADGDGWMLENDRVRARIDEHGLLVSFIDLGSGRDLIPAGVPAAVPELFRDTATKWDAWDVDMLDRADSTLLDRADSLTVPADAAPRRIEAIRTFGRSRLTQRYALRKDSAALDIDVDVDWQEEEKMVKLRFPIAVAADRYASQIQFGHVYRPLHENTSWDAARFEVCAHRFVHVADAGIGAGIVNDRTYGHDVTRLATERGAATVVRPTLLRAPRFPDPDGERGAHRFRFRLVVGDIADAVTEGYTLADAPRVVRGDHAVAPLVTVDTDRAVVETVKAAEDGSGDVIVRVYEAQGGRVRARVRPSFTFDRVLLTDLHERGDMTADLDGDDVVIDLDAFRFRTLRFVRS